jgi:hypothetical protein
MYADDMGVNLREYSTVIRERFAERSLKYATFQTGLDLFNCLNFTVTSRYPLGTNIFSRDWDLMIVLDACRVDVMNAVADEYDFITDVDSIWSVGSSSHEWTTQTFNRKYLDELRQTAFLSANPFSYRTLVNGKTPPYGTVLPFGSFAWNPIRATDLAYYEQVSSDGTKFTSTVPPWKMTDRLIAVGREHDFPRVAAHYFQPHRPFLTRTDDPMEESDLAYDHPMDLYDRGELSYDELWDAQLECLRAVLDCIGVLLSNFDAEHVAMTADHGQLMGEFGVTGHPGGLPFPHVKRVPWVEMTATDEETYTPRAEYSDRTEGIEDRLKHLGYI